MNPQTRDRKKYTENRVAKALDYLGGSCAVCGSTTNLEFDHVDPATKILDISSAIHRECWSWIRLKDELDKCQLLCNEHHLVKTVESYGEQPCGTYWKYRKYKCRCQPCVVANSEQLAKWKNKN